MSNDETHAIAAWKRLRANSVPNVYILEGGIHGWLDTFAKGALTAKDGAQNIALQSSIRYDGPGDKHQGLAVFTLNHRPKHGTPFF